MTRVRIAKKVAPGLSLDVDFAVEGGVTAIFGASGAGKTLLLEIIAGLVTPDSGRILLDEAIVFDAATRVNLPARKRRCGVMFQKDALWPHMTLRQNLAFAAGYFPRLERHRRVTEAIERFELGSAAELRPAEAPAAARLRCSAARAIINKPNLLLLDDAGVDEQLLATVRQDFGNPILLVTSDLDLCSAAADRLVLMEAGRILESGKPRELLDSPQSKEAARLLGMRNIFEGVIAALDPGKNSGRLDFEAFTLSAPYLPGHFRGDRVTVGIRPEAVRVHGGEAEAKVNSFPATLLRTSVRTRYVRMEFAGGIWADISHEQFARERDHKRWQVEFPPESLRIL